MLRPTISILLALVTHALVAPHAGAQVPGVDTLRLSVDEAVARAVAASPELLSERLELERARAGEIGAGAFFPEFPELEYSQATDAPFANEGKGNWAVGIAQEIELGGQSGLRRQIAELGSAAAGLRVRVAESAVRAEAREAIARLAAAEDRVRLFDTLAAFTRRLDVAAARLLAAEEISELDRNAIRIEHARAEIESRMALAELLAERAAIAVLVRAELGHIVVVEPAVADTTAVADAIARATSVALAVAAGDTATLASRADWQALEMIRRRAETERQLASRRTIPGVRVGLSLESETEPRETEPGVLQTDRLLGFDLGVKLPLPIPGLYDLGRGEVAIAEAEMAIAVAGQRALEARIRADIARSAARLQPAAEALAIYSREIAPLVARNLELLERGYRGGEIGATELITQQSQLVRAGEALIDARLEYELALADFERALGR